VSRLGALTRRIADAARDPEETFASWRRAGERLWGFVVHAGHEMGDSRAPQMAAALSFRTIFSIIPVLVLALVGLRAFYGAEAIDAPLNRILEYVGLTEITLEAESPAPAETSEDDAAAKDAEVERSREPQRQSVAQWIKDLTTRVQSLNFAAIGAIGALILVYAAFSLLIEIERAFNTIYRAPKRRRTFRQIATYWTILTLGPLALLSGFYVSERLSGGVEQVGGSVALSTLRLIVPLLISWLMLLLAYTLVPRTKVALRPALLGSFIGAALWELGKWGFREYVAFATGGYAAFYGSLGLIPIFLLWVYITWFVVLFGLSVSHAKQTVADRARGAGGGIRGWIRPAAAAQILVETARRFSKGETLGASDAADACGGSGDATEALLERLVDAGLLRRVEDEDEAFTLARPAEAISAADAIEAVRRLSGEREACADEVAESIEGPMLAAARERSIADLVRGFDNGRGGGSS